MDTKKQTEQEIDKFINDGIVELEMYDTTNQHSKMYGLDADRPLYIHSIIFSKEHIGSKVMKYIIEYAIKNEHDVIFGHIPNKAKPSINLIKSIISKSGFKTIEGNNDFYKILIKNNL